MIEIDIELAKPGDILGKSETFTNYESGGSVSVDLRKGVKLTQNIIDKLRLTFNVKTLWIEDDDIKLDAEILEFDEIEKNKTYVKIEETFNKIRNGSSFNIKGLEHKITTVVKELLEKLRNDDNTVISNIKNLVTKVDTHDSYTYEHSMNCAIYSIILTHNLPEIIEEYKKRETFKDDPIGANVYEVIAMNMLLHDIGKVKIPEHILNKKSKLTTEEIEEVKKHPLYGLELVKEINQYNIEKNIKRIPSSYLIGMVYHHENWDGTGYPLIKGKPLKGKEIPLIGRIGAVVDMFDALKTDRPYRDKLTMVEAIKIMYDEKGKKLDPLLTDRFLETLYPFSVGKTIRLTNGDWGIVMGYNKSKYNFDVIIKPYMRKIGRETIKLDGYEEKSIFDVPYDILLENDDKYKEYIRENFQI